MCATRGWEHATPTDTRHRRPIAGPTGRSGGRSKYGAIRTAVGDLVFASKREAARYRELKALWDAGLIHMLECQPQFPLWAIPNGCIDAIGVPVGKYIADFRYYNGDGELVIEDVKSTPTKTAVYRLKKRIVEAQYGIQIREIA